MAIRIKHREKNGRLQRPSLGDLKAAQDEIADLEKVTVRCQPHRHGSLGMDSWVYSSDLGYFVRVCMKKPVLGSKTDEPGTALGRFIDGRCRADSSESRAEWLAAGEKYFWLKHRWRVLNDIPEELRLREGMGAGEEPTEDEMHKLEGRIYGADRAMKRCAFGPWGMLAFRVTFDMLMHEADPHLLHMVSVKLALQALAAEFE